MNTQKTFTIYTANVTQMANNTKYPNKVFINTFDDLAEAITRDNVCSLFAENKRSVKNYLTANAFAMDIDNTHTENKMHQVTLQDVKDAFPGVAFYYVFSRNHLKAKVKGDGTVQAAREKMHIYFPLSGDCPKAYQDTLQEYINVTGALFPYFDAAASDTARFFFGVLQEPGKESGGYVPGEYCIDEYERGLSRQGLLNTAIKMALAKAEDIAIKDHGADWKDQPTKPFNDLVLWQERAAAITGTTAGSTSKKEYEYSINTTGQYPEIINEQQKELARYFKKFAKKHDIYYEEKIQGSFIYYFVHCPWENLHTTPDEKLQASIQIKAKDNGGAFIVFDCYHNHCQDKTWNDFKEFYEPTTEDIEEAPANLQSFFEKIQSESYRPYKTGLPWFDNLLGGGILKQSLVLLLSAPGYGKTTLCQQIAEAIAANKRQVIYFNLEMSREQMLAKILSSRLFFHGKKIRAKEILQGYTWTDEQRAAIERELADYEQTAYPYIKYNPINSGGNVDQLLKYLNKKGKEAKDNGQEAPVVVIDYLHLLTSAKKMETAELIKQSVTGLKKYALDYDTFVIAISATNRDSNRTGRINITSGRDSSNIEYTGDYVLTLNYEDIDKDTPNVTIEDLKNEYPRRMILRLEKNRFDAGGKQLLSFDQRHSYFYSRNDFTPTDNTPFSKDEKIF